jgi:hypothetical protein
MCIFSGDASVLQVAGARAGTVILIAEIHHPTQGLIHVLGYQNGVQSLVGPNAMILHFPAQGRMGPDNVIDTKRDSDFLDRMVTALSPPLRFRGATRGFSLGMSVQVFKSGIYTVVMSDRPSLIPRALETLVEPAKRPTINPELLQFYEDTMPGWTTAVCCFDNREAKLSTPMLWYYKPEFGGTFVAPGIDSHDGSPPNLKTDVETDHWVIVGSDRRPQQEGNYIELDYPTLDSAIAPYLPTFITGRRYKGMEPNGDFIIPTDTAFQQRKLTNMQRHLLPGIPA